MAMQPKPEALHAQRLADKKAAAGHFDVDENWSAAEVNARWGKRAVLTDGSGRVLDHAVLGARGMTDAGAREVQCKCGVWCAGIEELVRHRAARIAKAIKGGVE